jgi:adenylate cyclase
VTEPSIPLESILGCLQGVIPSPFATCSADGTPNVTYMSIVQYVDSERVALSRQFFRKSAMNLEENPNAQVLVVDPDTTEQYRLELHYLRTETDGPVFETMKGNLEAIASQTGMGADLFRLRGVDIHRVECCRRAGRVDPGVPARDPQRDVLRCLDEFQRRVATGGDYGEATRQALQGLEDLFGIRHAILLAADEDGDTLFGVAANGYPTSSAGAEVAVGVGVIGVAAARRQVITVPSLARSRVMRAAVQESEERRGGERGPSRGIPLPGLDDVQSVAAVPLVTHGALVGVLFLESDVPGRFGPHDERLLRVIGGHLAAVLSAFERDRHESVEEPAAPTASSRPAAAVAGAADPEAAIEVTYYQADDSVFADGEYVIKGVPGRILWKLLREHAADGRTAFTNRELRLDEWLGLPAGNDNLESRLVALRRRLEGSDWGIALQRVGRGRLALEVRRPLRLVEVPTRGPMRAAHADTADPA